jgi:hypothetical protein
MDSNESSDDYYRGGTKITMAYFMTLSWYKAGGIDKIMINHVYS